MKVLLIGGPGNISTSTVEYLISNGCEVSIFTLPNTDKKGFANTVSFFFGNRNNESELKNTLEEINPDIVADFCCFTPEQAQGIVKTLPSSPCKKYVFVSTVDVYGYPLSNIPFKESDPYNEPISQYAKDKLRCEEIFWEEYKKGNLPLTVVRPSYSFGIPFVLSFFSRNGGLELISRIKNNQSVIIPDSGDSLIHPSSAYNTGRMIAAIIQEESTLGEGFTCGHKSYCSAEAYYRLFSDALNVVLCPVYIPKKLLLPLEQKIIPDDLLSELTGFHVAFSEEKFSTYFPDFEWSLSLEDAALQYVDYHEKMNNIPPKHENFEDLLIKAWEQSKQRFYEICERYNK